MNGTPLLRFFQMEKRPDWGRYLSTCGCNSVVECQLPKLNVAGSSPVIRFFSDRYASRGFSFEA